MIVKLLTEHHLEFLSLKGGCRGSSEFAHVKMSNCWKSHATAQMKKKCWHSRFMTKTYDLVYYLEDTLLFISTDFKNTSLG